MLDRLKIQEEDQVTVWMEFVPVAAFTIWNLMVQRYGETAVFTYNGTSLCHSEDGAKGAHFALTVASYPNLSLLVDMISESEEDNQARVQEIKDNSPQDEFIWEDW